MWANHLNPDLNKAKWTLEEDLKLLAIVSEKGMAWSKVAKPFDGCRNEHMVKNRYNSITRFERKKKGSRTESAIIRKVSESIRKKLNRMKGEQLKYNEEKIELSSECHTK
jgi:hypothetical protein